jgi:hypothetical protein
MAEALATELDAEAAGRHALQRCKAIDKGDQEKTDYRLPPIGSCGSAARSHAAGILDKFFDDPPASPDPA